MELILVQTADPDYTEAKKLMSLSFPVEERRPTAQQRACVEQNSAFRPHIIRENNRFAGLLNYWTLNGFLYVEHLATLPSLRGQGLGKRIIETLTEHTAQPIVLEVEPPVNDIAARRINFYRRCGFRLWERHDYLQPPYADHLPALPLRLMAFGDLNEEKDFERVRHEIHTKVYMLQTPLHTHHSNNGIND